MVDSCHPMHALPDYEYPPVVEVVCGILFKPISGLLSPYMGLLWEKFRSEYPECREVPPLGPAVERFDEEQDLVIEIGDIPPLPRVWFISQDENRLVQVQRDRLLHNWRRARLGDEYPRYHKVMQMFRERLATFQTFLDENSFGSIEPLQYEMTYVNHIPQGEGWERLVDIGNVFPDLGYRGDEDRFLPGPAGVNWRTSFQLPDNAGRMHVQIRNVKIRDTGKLILLLELTVRGIGRDRSLDGMGSWFDLARNWIVCGFADLTGEEVQRSIWKRRQRVNPKN